VSSALSKLRELTGKHGHEDLRDGSPERQKAMNGLEFVRGLASGVLPLNTFAQTLGYDVVEAEGGHVVITVDPTRSLSAVDPIATTLLQRRE
jgi:hypothetical protein